MSPKAAAAIERAVQATMRIRAAEDERAQRADDWRTAREEGLSVAQVARLTEAGLVREGVDPDELLGLGVGYESIRKAAPGRTRKRS